MSVPVSGRGNDRVALERVEDALERLQCRPRRRGDHIDARCPVTEAHSHNDRRPSLSVDWRAGQVLVTCHRGCNFPAIVAALELEQADLWDEPPARSTERRPAASRAPRRKSASAQLRNDAPAGPAKKTARDPERDFQQDAPARPARSDERPSRAVARYVYCTGAGEVLGEVLRYEPKTFRWRKVVDGSWRWGAPDERPLYRLPAVAEAIAAGAPVYVAEGEKDAEALAAAGVCGTCNPGGAGPGKWRPEHTAALAGAEVVLIADRDEVGYRHAATVAAELEGVAASVRVVQAAEGKDAADHLVAGHTLAQLAPVPAEQLAAAAESDERPASRGRVVHGPWSDGDGEGGSGGGGRGGKPPASVRRDEFVLAGDTLCKRSGRELVEVLGGARVKVLRRVVRELGDGSVSETLVDLEAGRGAETAQLSSIEWGDFERVSPWVSRLPWADVMYPRTPRGRSEVVNAIMQTSGAVPMVTSYQVLGWRERPDGAGWMYVHAGGAVGARGPIDGIRVEIDQALSGYVLPAPPTTREELAAAWAATVEPLDRLPARVVAPVVGAAVRALLGECPATVMLVGSSGSLKSGVAALGLQHYAPGARYDQLPVQASEDLATMTSLEELRYLAGHSLFVADDLAPDRGAQRAAERANLLARTQGNRAGKLRARRDGGLRPTHRPRGLQLLTGEDGAGTYSAETRMVYLRLRPGDIDPDVLAELDTAGRPAARAAATAAMAQHYAARMPLDDWVRQARAGYASALRESDAASDGIASRITDTVAELAVGWRALLAWARAAGVIDEAEAERRWEQAWAGLLEAKVATLRATTQRTMPERFAELLRSALGSAAFIADPSGSVPPDALRWGWPDNWPVRLDGTPPRPAGQRCIGWTDGTRVWLEPGAAFAVAEAQGRAESDPLNVTKRRIGFELRDAGILRTEQASDGARTEVRARVGGARRRVWDVPAEWLWPEDAAPDAGGAGPHSGGTAPAGDGGHQPLPDPAPSPAEPPASEAAERPAESPGPPAEALSQPRTVPSGSGQLSGRYVAPAVVLGAWGGYFAAPHARGVSLPDCGSLGDLLSWAAEQRLGQAQQYTYDDNGQVWILPALAGRLGFPEVCPDSPRAAADLVAQLQAAGWSALGDHPFERWWVPVSRPDGPALQLVLPGWAPTGGCELFDSEDVLPSSDELAGRLARFAALMGTPWTVHGSVTGRRLLELSRVRAKVKAREPIKPPAPARDRGLREMDWLWRRGPASDEAGAKFVHAYDINGMYLAASSSVEVGIGEPEHLTDRPAFNKRMPGYWLLEPGSWDQARLPDLFDPASHGRRRGRVWVTTPTVAVAEQLGWIDAEPLEAWVWPGKARYLEQWYQRLRDARGQLLEAGHSSNCPILGAVKGTYAKGVGYLGHEDGHPLSRPDWRHHVVATARANLARKLYRAGESAGRYPLAVVHDLVLYPSNEPDPKVAAPAELEVGAGLGQVKVVGTAAAADVVPYLELPRLPKGFDLAAMFKGETGPRPPCPACEREAD